MQDNGELSGHRHPRFAIARSPGDGVPPILQARGFLEPRQDHDSSLVQQSTSECVAAPRYFGSATEINWSAVTQFYDRISVRKMRDLLDLWPAMIRRFEDRAKHYGRSRIRSSTRQKRCSDGQGRANAGL